MYRLYGNIAGWKELDRSEEEIDIVDTMGYYISNNSEINYIVIDNSQGYDNTYKTIKNRNEYVDYLNEVKNKYSSKTLTKHL